MSEARILSDLALLGVCDQLTDEELVVLGACAEDGDPVPEHIADAMTPAAGELLATLLAHEYGRLQVMDAVELEQHERRGEGCARC